MDKKLNTKNKVDSRNLDDYLGEKAELIEEGVKDAPVKDIKWEAQQIEAHSDPLVDKAQGKPIILRTFEFQLNPNLPKNIKFSKQDIFNSHKELIEKILWGDGLRPLDEVKPPKVQISKKLNKYRIFLVCQPRSGATVVDTMRKL